MAFEDFNLLNPTNPVTSVSSPEADVPDYLRAANLHNLGNNNTSWFSSAVDSIEHAPEFFAASALSGLNSFYNTGVQIGNLFGADNQERDTAGWISSFDSDLGTYYQQNSQGADMMGFLLTSLVPGTAGIKILNAGQKALGLARSGLIGENLATAFGLRSASVENYIATSAKEIASGQAMYSSLQSAGVKALAAGVYQNVLEGIAFETAIQTTMHASPILRDQDASDIAWNVATGGLMQGAIGGAFHAATTIGKINKAVRGIVVGDDTTQGIRPFASREIDREIGTTDLEIASLARQRETIPEINPGDANYTEQVKALEARNVRIDNDMRAKTLSLVNGNQKRLGNMVADLNVADSADNIMGRIVDTEQITNINGATKVESELAKLPLEAPQPKELQVHYWQLTGEDAGKVLNSKPAVYSIADTLSESGDTNLRSKVLSYVSGKGFKVADLWDAAAAPLTSQIGSTEAEARYIWASELMQPLKEGATVGQNDIPVLQRAFKDGQLDLNVVDENGAIVKSSFASQQEMQDFIIARQKDVARNLQQSALKTGTPFSAGADLSEAQDWVNNKIGKITNTKVSALEGTGTYGAKDYQAWQQGVDEYTAHLEKKGLKPVKGEETDPRFMPQFAKVTKRARDYSDADGTVVDAMTFFKQQQLAAQQATDRVVAKNLGDYSQQLPEITNDDLAGSNPRGTGAGLFTFSNPNQGSLGSKVSLIGSVVQRATLDAKKSFAEAIGGDTSALVRNNGAAIEWAGLSQKASRSSLQYTVQSLDTGERGLVSTAVMKSLVTDAEGELEPLTMDIIKDHIDSTGLPHFIPIEHDETWNLVQSHVKQDNKYTSTTNELGTNAGRQMTKQLDIFRPIPPNPQDYKFTAFVKDPKVTGQGHTSMIFAQNAEKLEALINKAKEARPDLDIFTKGDTEEFYKARGSYDWDRTLSENSIDSSLKNEGIFSDYFLKSDPQSIVKDFEDYHAKRIETQTREVVRAKYQPQFDWLEDQAKYYGAFDTSKIGGNMAALEATAKNPYFSYIKTALNLSRANENPLWYSVNKAADQAVSNVVGKIQDIWEGVKGTPSSPEFQYGVDNINRTLQRYGLNTGYADAATQLLVNEKLPSGVLSRFVSAANGILSKVVLGLDPLNAVTNAVGANILRMTELNSLIRHAMAGDEEVAGKLTKLAFNDVTGNGDLSFSAAKLNAGGIAAYFKAVVSKDPTEVANLELFRKIGAVKDIGTQFKDMLDNLTLQGSESTAAELNDRLANAKAAMDSLTKKGETLTGNKHAEDMNRFTTAWGMKQLTQPLVDSGEMSAAEQYAYINTHVNRVEGNTIASQRPFVFQGPIGQAVGLFQTYQFNLMQQMFRYVSEGSRKDAAMLLGLQGTFFGINGLPAFQAINQHIIGTASGNTRHTDAYDATYGIAGKNLGDLLMYGLPSNLLQTNLYSRGDINPRSVTILPAALDQVPVINATMKFFGGMKETVTKIANGGNVWESLLQGVEHSSLSRPLSGLAETLQATTGDHYVMSTTNSGGILYQNDLVSLATASRLAGGRPIDEAIVNDAVFRVHSYQQDDHAKMLELAGAVKSANIGGQQMDSDSIATFAQKYAEAGGKQINFNKFMVNEIKSVHTSAAEKIVTGLQNPFAQKMQMLMGANQSQSITDAQ